MVRAEAVKFHRTFLKPIEDKCIGLSEGNHYHEFINRETDTQFLCELMKVPYLDKPGFIRLTIRIKNHTMGILTILVHHEGGSNGSSLPGGALNVMMRKAGEFDCDAYIFSHDHRRLGYVKPVLTVPKRGALTIKEVDKVFLRSGCFIRGFDDKCMGRNYAQDKLLGPTSLGCPKLTIEFHKEASHARKEFEVKIGRKRRDHNGNYKHTFKVEV